MLMQALVKLNRPVVVSILSNRREVNLVFKVAFDNVTFD